MRPLLPLFCLIAGLVTLGACTQRSPEGIAPVEGAPPVVESPLAQTHGPSEQDEKVDVLGPSGLSLMKMTVPRAAHSSTLLPDGRVLLAGGFRQEGTREIAISSAEIFDPETQAFFQVGEMVEARSSHAAVLLPNGKVLLLGGWGPESRLETAEIFDPGTGKFSPTGSLMAPRASMTATLLGNGQVLVVGGESARATPQLAAELYDPQTGEFRTAVSLNQARLAHTATLLKDGRLLVVGGRDGQNVVLASAEVYDPATGLFELSGNMHEVRHKHGAVGLPDGKVLVLGGSDDRDWDWQTTGAELWDLATGQFSRVADLGFGRFKLAQAVTALPNGDVFIGGGNRQIEIFDWRSRQFEPGPALDKAYYFMAVTRLANGDLLLSGGYDRGIRPSDQAWIFHSKTWMD